MNHNRTNDRSNPMGFYTEAKQGTQMIGTTKQGTGENSADSSHTTRLINRTRITESQEADVEDISN